MYSAHTQRVNRGSPPVIGVRSGEQQRHSMKGNEDEGGHTERDRSPYKKSIVQGGVQREHIQSGNEDEGETRTRGNIPGQDRIRVSGSCVRTGSDSQIQTGGC